MRHGFTTGSCAQAAAKAAAYMLFSGKIKNSITIMTPKNIPYPADIVDIETGENYVSCGVIKDGGDDPDVTSGAVIKAKVSRIFGNSNSEIVIEGGEGVGRVTRPGLDQPVGYAAINSTPRRMIEKEVREVMEIFDCTDSLIVEISVPRGEEIALKTFNPRLGIEGGISIIGTSGIVEPMSMQAIRDTIRIEIRQRRALGFDKLVIAPGNYGIDFMKENYSFDLDRAVKCSNFVGDTIDMAIEEGISKLLLFGHIGKLIKLSGGIMNTHSSEANCRMELMAAAALKCGMDQSDVLSVLDCLTTDEAFEIVKNAKKQDEFMHYLMDKIQFYLQKRAGEKLEIECIVFSNVNGILGETEGASALIEEIINE